MAQGSANDLRLLVRLIRRDVAGIARCRAPGVSLDRIADLSVANGLSVPLLRALAGSPMAQELSPERLEALDFRRQRQERRSRILLETLARLRDRFATAGQPFILLKGPSLASRFYGDGAGREFVDLDLLVPSADRQRACRLLSATGYRRRSRLVLTEGVTAFFVHGFDYSAGDAHVDLHWCLARHPSVALEEKSIWARRQSCDVEGRAYATLSDEDEVVFSVLSLLRDIERGRPKIKNVVDIIQIVASLDAAIDWERLFTNSHRVGTFGPLVNVLGFSLDATGARDLAPRLSSELARHAARRVPVRPTGSPLQFAPARLGLGNRLWSARTHDASPIGWLLWWSVSLPFRLAVHRRPERPGFVAEGSSPAQDDQASVISEAAIQP